MNSDKIDTLFMLILCWFILILKIDGCSISPENLQEKIKIGEHIPCGYSILII